MALNDYKVLHILGLLLVFSAVGAATLQAYIGASPDPRARRLQGIAHGLGLLILLISGFGALARLGVGFPAWVWVKLVIWLLFGVVTVILRKMPQSAAALWFLLPVLGAFAAYLALNKPF